MLLLPSSKCQAHLHPGLHQLKAILFALQFYSQVKALGTATTVTWRPAHLLFPHSRSLPFEVSWCTDCKLPPLITTRPVMLNCFYTTHPISRHPSYMFLAKWVCYGWYRVLNRFQDTHLGFGDSLLFIKHRCTTSKETWQQLATYTRCTTDIDWIVSHGTDYRTTCHLLLWGQICGGNVARSLWKSGPGIMRSPHSL